MGWHRFTSKAFRVMSVAILILVLAAIGFAVVSGDMPVFLANMAP